MHQARVKPSLERFFGVRVVLACGSLVTAGFTARRSSKAYDTMGKEGEVLFEISLRQYYLPVASIVIAGELVEPQRGWIVIDGSDEFEILPRDDGSHAAELDSLGFDWIVNTKRRRGPS
jgi:hypothetical protein